MNRRVEKIAATLARAWVRLYTSGMPGDLREGRRAEIDADLWEHQQDSRDNGASAVALGAEILLRTLLGIPDDVGWRRDALHGRMGIMAISVRKLRWMGLCTLLGGALMAGGQVVDVLLGHPGRVYTSETSWRLAGTASIVMPLLGGVVLVLCSVGVVGLCLQYRARAGKAGRAGFILLLTGFGSIGASLATGAIFGYDGAFEVLMNVLLIPGHLVMIPLGFFLLGIGMPSPSRRVPLFLGCYLIAQSGIAFVAVALRDRFPSASVLYRSDSVVGIASSIILGLGLAVLGYSIWSGSKTATRPEAPL